MLEQGGSVFELFASPWVDAVLCTFAALGALFVAYVEIPPKTGRRTGKKRSLVNRLQSTSRLGKVFLLVGVLMSIAAVFAILEAYSQ